MNKPKFAGVPIPSGIESMARRAPGGAEVLEAPTEGLTRAPDSVTPSAPPEPAQQPMFPRREAKQNMNLRMPKSLYDEMRDFMKLTDIPMTEILVEGARNELARLKKKYGIDK
jgi:hypothetical protein